MHNILFFLTIPTKDVAKLQGTWPILFEQPKENNNIFSELLLFFKETQDENILEGKLSALGIEIFLCEPLF